MEERVKEVLEDGFVNKLYSLNYEENQLRDVLYHVLFNSRNSALNALDEPIKHRRYSQSITECVREIMIDIIMNDINLKFEKNNLQKIIQN